ncbi:MAG: hypothetical protein KF905_11750 [Flavobacteriales bacterium]|nr:hypothetical protein [Flavobacteriales bacterium]
MSSIAIEQQQSDKRTGAIVTVVFHILLAILFLFLGLKQPDPLPKDEPIELVMEDMGGGGGSIAAPTPGNPQPTPSTAPATAQPEDVATQDDSPVEQPKPVKPQPKPKPAPTTPAPPQPNPNALFTPSNTQPTTQTGPPGGSNPADRPGAGGTGSFHGKGFEGRLDGRGLSKTPSFGNDNTEAGKVAVDIRVDPTGKVVYAKGRLGSPTTTTSSQLHRLAEGYARQFSFTANAGASNDQAGFIVFEFTLQ